MGIHRRLRPLAGLALLASLAIACGAAETLGSTAPSLGERSRVTTDGGTAVAPLGMPAPASAGDAKAIAPVSSNGQPGQPATAGVPRGADPTRALIVTGSVQLRAGDPWAVADRVQAIATGLGGNVLSLAQSGSGDQRSAAVTLRVPSNRFADALAQLRSLDAEVLTSSMDSKDVTDQFVDLEARLKAKQAEEARYLALLARAERIEDILRIDQALTNVRTQIEQLTGQINSIRSRTEYSTIAVSVSSKGVLPTTPGQGWDPAKTAERAVGSLLALFRFAADAAIWLVVLGWLPGIALLGTYLVARNLRAARA
ncbi:MAG: DUF4349 domain-containing protein [Chloroflexi bacterium]|nr:DUF4349 domain-containing protein [Chloroflexota bacterium]